MLAYAFQHRSAEPIETGWLVTLAHDAARAKADVAVPIELLPAVLVLVFVPDFGVVRDHLPDHAHGGDGVREPLELADVLKQKV